MNQEIKVDKKQIVFGLDSVIIQKWISDIKGGRALDVAGIDGDVLYAGRVIITDGKGVYKPLKIEGGNYVALSTESGFKYAGVLYRSISKGDGAAIMTAGQVNTIAAKSVNGADFPTDFAEAMPNIQFVADEDANKFDQTDSTVDKD